MDARIVIIAEAIKYRTGEFIRLGMAEVVSTIEWLT